MDDKTQESRIVVERRKRICPKYKGQSMTWKRLFIGSIFLMGILAYLLGMTIKGNANLQRKAAIVTIVREQ